MPDQVKILVVESDQSVALTLATEFRLAGWVVVSAADAMTALSVALKSLPDAVVLNARIPGGGGLTALKRMRASVHTAMIPVIVVTADGASHRQELLAAGAQECLDAPPNAAVLIDAIRKHLAVPHTVAEAPREILRNPARLAALQASGILENTQGESYDIVTRLVAKLLDVPTALLSIVDKDRQVFKSHVGLPEPWSTARETPLSHSFCQWVVSGNECMAINDAEAHPLLRTNLAIRDLGVIAYAGAPVSSGDRSVLGSLCAIDAKPRSWTGDELASLSDLAKLIDGSTAQTEMAREGPHHARDLDRYIGGAGNAILGAMRILRRAGPRLGQDERDALLGIVEEHAQSLAELNRNSQVGPATTSTH